MLRLCLLVTLLAKYCQGVCQFQNPFYFIDRPSVVTVVDSSGQMVADRVRVTWGRVQNFKCVDYYQIEYWNEEEPDESFAISEKINRHRDSHDITIKPCRNYLFKVIASEDWRGVRQDYRVGSDTVKFRVDYAPKFIRPPVITERAIRIRTYDRDRRESDCEEEGDREKRQVDFEPYIPFKKRMKSTTTTEPPSTTTPPPYNVLYVLTTSHLNTPLYSFSGSNGD